MPDVNPNITLPYEAVSVNGRAMEWKKPLWDAIHRYERAANDHAREAAVVDAERAVEQAMALAVELAPPSWQPITTAPKDGTIVIGYDPSNDGNDYLNSVEFMRWDGESWIDPATHTARPTHWMPLPSPPSVDEQRKAARR